MTKAPTRDQAHLLAVAAKYEGYGESDHPCDNSNIFAPRVGHANCNPWCASYVNAVFKEAGFWDLLPDHSAYTPTSFQGFVNKHQTVSPDHPELWEPGDVLYWQWPGMGRIAHISIFEKLIDLSHELGWEGNTNAAGSRTGGSVLHKTRNPSMVAGVGRPKWSTAPAELPPSLTGGDMEAVVYCSGKPLVLWSAGKIKPLKSNAEARALKPLGINVITVPPAQFDLIAAVGKR